MSKFLKILLPILVLSGGAAVAFLLVKMRKPPAQVPYEEPTRIVRTMEAEVKTCRFDIRTSGFVQARARSQVSAQVPGQVVKTSDRLYPGEFFKAGSELLTIDPADYQIARTLAESRVAEARTMLAEEEARSEQAIENWRRLGKTGKPSDLAARVPQLENAKRALVAAQAELKKSEIDLTRTSVKAPFDALIYEKSAEVGHYVTPGSPLLTLLAVDFAEVRLPLDTNETRFLDLPSGTKGKEDREKISVKLTFGDDGLRTGYVIRSENVIDETTRSIYAIARIPDPYLWLGSTKEKSSLAVGQFVEAALKGRPVEGLVEIPTVALRGSSEVVLVSKSGIISIRKIEVVHDTKDSFFVRGINEGELVVLTSPPKAIEGEKVRVVNQEEVANRE